MPVGKGSIQRASNASIVTENSVMQNEVLQKAGMQNELSQKDDVSQKDVTQKDVTQKDVSQKAVNMTKVLLEIPMDQIIRVPENWGKDIQLEAQVSELIESIRKYGMIEPVILRQTKDNKFQLLSGYSRLKAMRELGLITVTARVLEGLSDKDAKEIFDDLHAKKTSKGNPIHEAKFSVISSITSDMPTYLL